ncbi:MAG: aspartyl protease family protein [Planctomycetia bacterium]|nr:aspartyl protease family protein [Planctomycetia bacterium]
METSTMGRVVVSATIDNLQDLFDADRKLLANDKVRRVTVDNALVDTGATMLSLPTRLIQQLGLRPLRKRQARTSGGAITVQLYGSVRLTIQGRDCISDVTEVPDDCPALIGQIPLELLDFVVDPANQRLIGNPAHGGEHVVELY